MENDIRQEIDSLKRELQALKKEDARKERIIRKLSVQLRKTAKTLRTVKESSRRNANDISSLKGTLRTIAR